MQSAGGDRGDVSEARRRVGRTAAIGVAAPGHNGAVGTGGEIMGVTRGDGGRFYQIARNSEQTANVIIAPDYDLSVGADGNAIESARGDSHDVTESRRNI